MRQSSQYGWHRWLAARATTAPRWKCVVLDERGLHRMQPAVVGRKSLAVVIGSVLCITAKVKRRRYWVPVADSFQDAAAWQGLVRLS